MFRLLGVLTTTAILIFLMPAVRAQSVPNVLSVPSSDFRASLEISNGTHIGERLNDIELRIRNVGGLTYSFSVAAPWEMAELLITHDGVTVRPGQKRSPDGVDCGGQVNLPPGWEMAVNCGYRVSTDSYMVGRTWSLRDFGYCLDAPGHYVIRARVRIFNVRPLASNATTGTQIYLDTAPIEMTIPR
jgi:hypothetical protein